MNKAIHSSERDRRELTSEHKQLAKRRT